MSLDKPNLESSQAGALSRLGSRTQTFLLLGAIGLGAYICYRLALPFLSPLIWALALAILFAPAQGAIEERLRRPNLAAAISILMAAIVVVAPAIFVTERLVAEAAKGASFIQAQVQGGAWRRAIEAHPRLGPIDEWLEQQIDLPAIFGNAASWLTNAGASFVRGSVAQIAGFLLTFYFLFYFLRDRREALNALRRLSPLSLPEMDRLFDEIADTVHATIYGTAVIAAVQGALGGLMFWQLGLPTPLLWGLVMGLLAIVPVLGAFVVWAPATVFLALEGDWTKAVILGLWGGAVVSTIDNLLYPILIGNRLKLHSVPAFISLIGGLSVFGAAGVILGPIAVTTTATLLEAWRARIAEAKE